MVRILNTTHLHTVTFCVCFHFYLVYLMYHFRSDLYFWFTLQLGIALLFCLTYINSFFLSTHMNKFCLKWKLVADISFWVNLDKIQDLIDKSIICVVNYYENQRFLAIFRLFSRFLVEYSEKIHLRILWSLEWIVWKFLLLLLTIKILVNSKLLLFTSIVLAYAMNCMILI